MERFTPLYAIAYAITNSMENLRFEKEGYFHVLVFYGLFYERNRTHFSHVLTRYRNTRGSLGELEIAWKRSPYRLVFPLQFLVLPNFHSCFYNCMETRKMFSISWIEQSFCELLVGTKSSTILVVFTNATQTSACSKAQNRAGARVLLYG